MFLKIGSWMSRNRNWFNNYLFEANKKHIEILRHSQETQNIYI